MHLIICHSPTFLGINTNCNSQEVQKDTTINSSQSAWSKLWKEDSTKPFKNVIKANLSNHMIFSENYNVSGNERILTNHQSVNFIVGRFSIPRFSPFDGDKLYFYEGSKDKGLIFTVDYRFYLKNENKYAAPHGI